MWFGTGPWREVPSACNAWWREKVIVTFSELVVKMDGIKFECMIISKLHTIDHMKLQNVKFSPKSGMSYIRVGVEYEWNQSRHSCSMGGSVNVRGRSRLRPDWPPMLSIGYRWSVVQRWSPLYPRTCSEIADRSELHPAPRTWCADAGIVPRLVPNGMNRWSDVSMYWRSIIALTHMELDIFKYIYIYIYPEKPI